MKSFIYFIFSILISLKLHAAGWSYPLEISGTETKEPPSAVVYGSDDDQRIVLFWKNKSTAKLDYTFSDKIEADNAISFNNPIYDVVSETSETVQPVTYPSALVANGELYVYMIDYEKQRYLSHVMAKDLETLTAPTHWESGRKKISSRTLKGGVTTQVIEDVVFLTMKTYDSYYDEQYVHARYYTFDQELLGKEVYQRHTQAGANIFFNLQEGGKKYDLHAIRISSQNEMLVHYEEVDEIKPPSNFNGEKLRDDDGKKFNVKSQRIEMINSGLTHAFFNYRSDNSIGWMWFDKKWTGFEKLSYEPSRLVFKTDMGVSVVEAQGTFHLFFVDKDKGTIHHTFLEK